MKRASDWLMIAGLAVGIFTPPEAKASVPFQPVSPEEIKMTSESLAPGAPAIILFRQVDRDDSGLSTRENEYVRIKILTE
jgi:hypothetical protein